MIHCEQYQRYDIGTARFAQQKRPPPPFLSWARSWLNSRIARLLPLLCVLCSTLYFRLRGCPIRGHLDVVRWLVRTAGAESDRPNDDGCTPLLFACEQGHVGVAQWLVREGGAKVTV